MLSTIGTCFSRWCFATYILPSYLPACPPPACLAPARSSAELGDPRPARCSPQLRLHTHAFLTARVSCLPARWQSRPSLCLQINDI